MASQMASCNSGCCISRDVQYLDFLFLHKPITSWVLASKAELKKKKTPQVQFPAGLLLLLLSMGILASDSSCIFKSNNNPK